MAALPSHYWFDAARVGEVTVVRFTLDRIWKERTAEAVSEELMNLAQEGCRRLVLNFAGVQSMGSVMLSKLNSLRQRFQADGGGLVLCALNPVLSETLEVTKMAPLFHICEAEPEAIDKAQQVPSRGRPGPENLP